MMRVIPTYTVTFAPLKDATVTTIPERDGTSRPVHGPPTTRSYRVPETSLEAFLHVLVFNGTTEFSVKREEVSIPGQVAAGGPL